jgi:thiol-disulfide isomerase/thioredoxin
MRVVILVILLFFTLQIDIAKLPELNKIQVMKFDQFRPYLSRQNDTIYLINFWATWCAPCREELPAIQNAEKNFSKYKFKILLVSLDFPNQLKTHLLPFIKSNQIKSEVILLDDHDQNRWIDIVDPGWSGEIPFTVIYGKDFREFYSRSFRSEELDSILKLKLKLL